MIYIDQLTFSDLIFIFFKQSICLKNCGKTRWVLD